MLTNLQQIGLFCAKTPVRAPRLLRFNFFFFFAPTTNLQKSLQTKRESGQRRG